MYDLEITRLKKEYSGFKLDSVSFKVEEGTVMGLIGPNGAGKTTTIKLILNMIHRNGGYIKIFGLDNIEHEKKIKERLGVVFDNNYFVDLWTVRQAEEALARFYPTWDRSRFIELVDKFKIDIQKKVRELSKGMQMKLMLACAFSYDAKLLILDEPTSGLDPASRDELLILLAEYVQDRKHTVLFSTHITSDLEKIADSITYINLGKMIYTGSTDRFTDRYRIVRCDETSLVERQKEKFIKSRTIGSSFEGLIDNENVGLFDKSQIYKATIDDIIIYTGMENGGENL